MGYSKAEIYGNAKLSHSDVRAIRARGGAGEHPRALAQEYRVAPETIRKVLRWDTYTMVPEEGPGFVPRPEPSGEEIAASQARLLAKLGMTQLASPPIMPSLEEVLKQTALREAAAGSPGLDKLQATAGQGDALLAGLLDSNGLQLDNPPVVGGTDGGTK